VTLAIFFGFVLAAAAGTVIRFGVGVALNPATGGIPVGTLAVNIAGSFCLGLVASSPDWAQIVFGIGALGALSTWSAVANEAATLSRRGEGWLALAYLLLTTSSSVLAAWFGIKIGVLL